VLTSGEVESLAEIEPRDVLLARLAGGFQAPLVKAAGLFQAFTRNFAYGIKAYVEARIEGGEALEVPETPAAPTSDTDTDTETDAEQAPADGVSPAAASDAIEKES
jgi:large subunit ribosomal protein L10